MKKSLVSALGLLFAFGLVIGTSTVIAGNHRLGLGQVASNTQAHEIQLQSADEWIVTTVDGERKTGSSSSLALDSQSHAHISYVDYGNGHLRYAFQDANGWYTQTVDTTNVASEGTSLALNAAGFPHVSYQSGYDLKYAYQNDVGWYFQTVDTVGEPANQNRIRSSLGLDETGRPHISYYDPVNDDLKYAVYNGAGWDIEIVEADGNAGFYNSLALDSQNRPHVSFYSLTDTQRIKYSIRTESGWQIQTVDSVGAGPHNAIALDGDGRPHIAYYTYLRDTNLYYAYLSDNGWEVEVADGVGNVGSFPSIVVDEAGRPHVSYYSVGDNAVRYAFRDTNGEWHTDSVASGSASDQTALALDEQSVPHISFLNYLSEDLMYAYYSLGDGTAPAAINDLTATPGNNSGQVNLVWTAPGDDGDEGVAANYIIRYATSAIETELGWELATEVDGGPVPQAAGTQQSMTVSGLTPGETHYFAIRTEDEVGNLSGLSNSPSAAAPGTSVESVEFTQAIQEWQPLDEFKSDIADDKTPPVPLIANKPLVLRVYMEEVNTATQVTVRLSRVATAERTVTLQPNCTTEESRLQENGCQSIDFYFTPPAGNWTATINIFDEDGNEVEAHDFALTSVETQVLTLRAVSVCDSRRFGLFGTWRCAEPSVLNDLEDFLERTAPTHDVEVIMSGHTIRRNTLFYLNYGNWWVDIARDIHNLGTEPYYYGMVRTEAPTSIGGIAHNIPSHGGASRTSVIRLGTETNDEVVAHETGHMLGRWHTNQLVPFASGGTPPGCYSLAKDSSTDWPYNNNRIQSGPADSPTLEVGFDVANRRALNPQNTYDWMSYCVPRWISPHTYRNALNTLRATHDIVQVPELTSTGNFWRISGVIEGETVTFDPVFTLETTAPTTAGSGSHRIEVQDGSGATLFTRYFTPGIVHTESEDPADDIEATVFSEPILVQEGASYVTLVNATGVEMGSIHLAGEAPTVTMVNPTGGEMLSDIETLEWQVTDPDSTKHQFWVEYSPDNGTSWRTLAGSLTETTLEVDFTELAGSNGAALVRVHASDGQNSTTAASANFTVPKKPVVATIASPENGAVFQPGDLVLLKGNVHDPEDGAAIEVTWQSDPDGLLGSGNQLPIYDLSVGSHTVSLTAQDSDGNIVTDTVNLYIDGTPPDLSLDIRVDGSPASCVDVTIDAVDPADGSGLQRVEYSFDGGDAWIPAELDTLPLSFRVPGEGLYHLVVHALDRANNLSVDDRRFSIESTCPNELPSADAGDGYTGNEGMPVIVDGSSSFDPDGSIILFQWDLDADGEYETTGISSEVTFQDNGTYLVTLKVTDNGSGVTTTTVPISITNVAPTVDAGSNIETVVGESVALAEANYSDQGLLDTHTASIDWGDGLIEAVPATNGVVIPSLHTYDRQGIYTAKVCVTDDDGGESCDSLTITVEPDRRNLFLPIILHP